MSLWLHLLYTEHETVPACGYDLVDISWINALVDEI